MKLTIDKDTGEVFAQYPSLFPLPRGNAFLGSQIPVVVNFISAGTLVELDGDNAETGELQVNLADTYGGNGIATASEWTKTGTGASALYAFSLSFNTQPALDAFEANPDTVDARLELRWINGDEIGFAQIPLTIHNVNNLSGVGELDPVATSEGWLSARALRFDEAQTLTSPEKVQALANLGISIDSGGLLTFHTGHTIRLNAP